MELKLSTTSRSLLVAVVLAAAVWACDSNAPEPDPIKVPVFELEVDLSYTTSGADHWIILSNDDGKIIAFAPYQSGDNIALEADENEVGDKISVTTLRHTPPSESFNKESFRFTTYTDIEVGEKMVLKYGPSAAFTGSLAPITLNLSNLPYISERKITLTSLGSYVNGYSGGGINDKATYTAEVGLPHKDLFVAVTSSVAPRYLELDLAETPGGTFDFLTDFKVFDHVIALPTPSSRYNVAILGYRNTASDTGKPTYRLHVQSLFDDDSYGQLQVGFNDGYDKYHTSWTIKLSDGSTVGYSKTGPAAEAKNFEIPDLDFTVVNSGINEFEFTSGDEFTYRTSSYSVGDLVTEGVPIVSWGVMSPADSKNAVIREFTDSLDVVFPYLNTALEGLGYGSTSFVKNIDGQTYEHQISNIFGYGEGLVETAFFTKTK